MNALFHGSDRILMGDIYRGLYIELAMALDNAGRTDEAITALTKAVEVQEDYIHYGNALGAAPDAEVHFSDPMWNRLPRPAFPRKFPIRFYERFAEQAVYAQNEHFCLLMKRALKLS